MSDDGDARFRKTFPLLNFIPSYEDVVSDNQCREYENARLLPNLSEAQEGYPLFFH